MCDCSKCMLSHCSELQYQLYCRSPALAFFTERNITFFVYFTDCYQFTLINLYSLVHSLGLHNIKQHWHDLHTICSCNLKWWMGCYMWLHRSSLTDNFGCSTGSKTYCMLFELMELLENKDYIQTKVEFDSNHPK